MAVAAPPPEFIKRRVLVVDDDPLVLRWLAHKLNALGYIADVASEPAKAIALASAYDYDVAVTDLLMPQVNGIELMAILARSSAATSFILISGARDFQGHDSRAVDGRLTTVLAKPFDDGELEKALRHAVEVADTRRSRSVRPETAVRVLLVEDSASDALLIKQALQTLGGYDVTHVVKLADAVKVLHEEAFDTVITDLALPDARGLGSVLRLRECAPDATLLVCSSVADEVMALRVIELGAQDFIVKGIYEAEVLGRAIRFARVRRQAERRLTLLAHTDPLTGLANRGAFAARLDQALSQAKRQATQLGVMYIDLDGFKAVNDEQGHDAGDAVLQQVASRMRQCVREYDVVARLGGDEFAVLVTNLAEGALERTAQRIARAIAAPVNLASGSAQVTASIGVAGFPECADEAVLLVRLADDAMYAAKRSGKNRVHQAPRMAEAKPTPISRRASHRLDS